MQGKRDRVVLPSQLEGCRGRVFAAPGPNRGSRRLVAGAGGQQGARASGRGLRPRTAGGTRADRVRVAHEDVCSWLPFGRRLPQKVGTFTDSSEWEKHARRTRVAPVATEATVVELDRERIKELTDREERRLNERGSERDVRARAQDPLRRRRFVVPGARSVADLPRAQPGREGLGRRRERAPRLPQRLRLDGAGPCASGDREGRCRALQARHALRRADGGRGRGRRGARAPMGPAQVAVRTPGRRRRWTRSASPARSPAGTRS